uniref:SET domain-containing protein n=1 Tax=Trichuris muris TaxID=70415 RepID=A0A5S6Q7K9_TRIMR
MLRICDDISNGKEPIPVSAFGPASAYVPAFPQFTYTTDVLINRDSDVPQQRRKGCRCVSNCLFNNRCCCQSISFGDMFTKLSNVVVKDWRKSANAALTSSVFLSECHEGCSCATTCPNKATQCPLKFKFYVGPCGDKGWGLFAGERIPASTFLFHYAGMFLQSHELTESNMNDYLFMVSVKDDPSTFSYIDAFEYGNLSRFVNHSCVPNCFVSCVHAAFVDRRLSRLCFFSRYDIQQDEEITIDYSDSYWTYKTDMKCLCNKTECRYKR